ncbi:rRNA maturation RNase YbeY [Limibacterium fermenti]|uniref:rRNA maturation RNase YbeY n=1 Tax=Limibacterium fermenti TaxID=3229863 RepID=UPI003A5FD484
MTKSGKRKTAEWIQSVAKEYGKQAGSLSYLFCSDEKILEVNRHYLQHDFYTDIITFDYTEEDILAGDIIISVDTVHSNAEKFGTLFAEELNRVIIHGVLHLCGINDKTEDDAKRMREAEEKALQMLRTR